MQRGFRASVLFRSERSGCWAQVLFCLLMLPIASVSASDVYYRTLMPPMLPPSPPAGNRPGILNRFAKTHSERVGRVQKTVILADEPRQAALSALQNPCLGVTLAGYALSAGMDAERENLDTCVDLYFERSGLSVGIFFVAPEQRFGQSTPRRGSTIMRAWLA